MLNNIPGGLEVKLESKAKTFKQRSDTLRQFQENDAVCSQRLDLGRKLDLWGEGPKNDRGNLGLLPGSRRKF